MTTADTADWVHDARHIWRTRKPKHPETHNANNCPLCADVRRWWRQERAERWATT